MYKYVNNELDPSLLSSASLSPWVQHNSASRLTMFTSSHLGQTLVVEDSDIRRSLTGTESEFGKYTFSIKFPCDANIIKVIRKYRPSIGKGSVSENPLTLIIYENIETKEVGMLEVLDNSLSKDNKHQYYGFKYKPTDLVAKLQKDTHVPKGTVVADSPNIDPHGNYKYGVETNVAFMSVPGTIEDGVVVSRSYLNRIKTKGFEKRIASWGSKVYPLNLYGDSENYKPFPEIGDKIREDGLLFALRTYDELLSPVEMSALALDQPDYIFDKLIYGVPGATVVDIGVQHNTSMNNPPTPSGMEEQAKKYYDNEVNFHKSIIEVYDELYKVRRKDLSITPEFHRQVVESLAYVGMENIPEIRRMSGRQTLLKRKVDKKYRTSDIDDWMVTVQFEYTVVPDIGFKLSSAYGGKGVICQIVESDSDMPTDKDGNIAEIIFDSDSIIKRMNLGVLYEQYVNATSRDISKQVRYMVKDRTPSNYKEAWALVKSYYEIISPKMVDLLESPEYTKSMDDHIDNIVKNGIYLWLPTDNPIDSVEAIKKLRETFKICLDKVTYEGVLTEKPVLIGSIYILLLEKTANDWSAVGSSKLQHFGIPAKITQADKYSSPGRNSPIRILGESEVRLMNATVGSDVVADLLDQSNSPATHKAIVDAILKSDKPTGEYSLLDRKKIPVGNARGLQFVKHVAECGGVKFVRHLDDPIRASDVERQLRKK